MRDLHLWRLLRARSFEPTVIIPLLKELAGRPLAERLPFLGLLPPALQHTNAAVRAAAVPVLAGARGRLALHHAIAALQDDDPAVRLAAVDALHECVRGDDTARWAHVMFHPDAAVRGAGLAKEFPAPYLYRLFLIADPVHGDAVRKSFEEQPLPDNVIPQILDYHRRGTIDGSLGRRLAGRLNWEAWHQFLDSFYPRHDNFDVLLERTRQPNWPEVMKPEYHPDQLDDVLHLFWDEDPAPNGGPSGSERFFRMLLDGALSGPPHFHQWLGYTLLGVAAQRNSFPQAALEACTVFHPDTLVCPWLPLDVRRRAIHGLYRCGQRCKRRPTITFVKGLAEGELCCHAGSDLDLWAVGGLLRLLDDRPYAHLIDWFGIKRLVEQTRATVEPVPALLGMKDDSEKGRRFLLNRILEKPWPQRDRLVALLAWHAPATDGRLLDKFEEPDDALRICGELLALEPAGAAVGDKGLQAIAKVVGRTIPLAPFLKLWLERPDPEKSALGRAVLGRICRRQRRAFSETAAALPTPLLLKLLPALDLNPDFPYDQELRLAEELDDHPDAAVRQWAAARRLLPPLFKAGLFERLRGLPAGADLDACTAALTATGPLEEADALLARLGADDADFVARLERSLTEFWAKEKRLPILGHALLASQDRKSADVTASQDLHASAFGEQVLARWSDGFAGGLRHAETFAWKPMRARFWEAAFRAMDYWRREDRARLAAAWNDALGEMLLGLLEGDRGAAAVKLLTTWADTGAGPLVLQKLHDHVLGRVPELGERARNLFGALGGTAPSADAADEAEVKRRVAASKNLDELTAAAQQPAAAEAAARRLVALGKDGAARLLALFKQPSLPPTLDAIARTVGDWPPPTRTALRTLVADATAAPEARFRAGLGLAAAGAKDPLPHLIDAIAAPADREWFTHADRELLEGQIPEAKKQYPRLLQAAHAAAQAAAVQAILAEGTMPETVSLLRGFLESGAARDAGAKMLAAEYLATMGAKEEVLPLLLQGEPQPAPRFPELLGRLPEETVVTVVDGVLAAGRGEPDEKMLLALLKSPSVGLFAQESGLARLLSEAQSQEVRTGAREALGPRPGRLRRLRRVAETFAWGVRIGRELTGKLFTLEMIANEQLGYTRFRENKLYITPMPLLRGVQNGREVVRALILHEYGHHMYHRGKEAEAVWQKAQNEQMHSLLNLVSDEHLERNLRSLDTEFGDQLKMLGAYAFQHAAREFAVDGLLNTLGGQAFEVLTTVPLGAARQRGCLAVSSGRLLREMERTGMSFARFVRALRMGLGNRHDDPKVEQGLELFKGRFRHSTMEEMYDISKKLREIFGQETDILNSFSMDAALCDGDPELLDGITREELQREIQDTLKNGPHRTPPPEGVLGGLGMNKGPEENFDLIHDVTQMQHDKAQHAVYVQKVQRQAEKMRRYFDELGIGWEPQRLRVRGRSFDRTRVGSLVLHNDPRILTARELKSQTDLFLGVVIDCSGSMAGFQSMEKAKLFGTLLAEAAKDNKGIDVRLFGFTDKVVYDAGSAARCAVHALRAGGGNNDAAALWHAALVAKASKRKAKLLVQISDGAPTECTVTALRSLVERLTKRWKFCCAQVAVRPLEEICFPNYVLLEDNNLEACTRQFGLVIARLVRQALRG